MRTNKIKVRKKAKIRNRYNLTQDIIWETDKNTRKLHIQESKEVSPVPTGDHKAAKNRQSKKEGKYQESIQSSTTPEPGYQWERNKLTIRHHKREPRGQPFRSR